MFVSNCIREQTLTTASPLQHGGHRGYASEAAFDIKPKTESS